MASGSHYSRGLTSCCCLVRYKYMVVMGLPLFLSCRTHMNGRHQDRANKLSKTRSHRDTTGLSTASPSRLVSQGHGQTKPSNPNQPLPPNRSLIASPDNKPTMLARPRRCKACDVWCHSKMSRCPKCIGRPWRCKPCDLWCLSDMDCCPGCIRKQSLRYPLPDPFNMEGGAGGGRN